MKIQTSRFAAITSALSLVVTGLVGVQPASAAGTSPAWDSNATNGGIPVVTISNDTVTVVSIPDLAVPGGFRVIYACNQAIDAGFYSWSAPVGQPIYPPAGEIDSADCVQLAINVASGSTVNLLTAQTNANGPVYSPATHGTHIVAGFRQSDSAGAGSADDLMWAAVGNSVVYTPPAPPTASSQPTLSLTGTAIQFVAGTFSGGSGSVSSFVYSCSTAKTAITSPTSDQSLGLGGCRMLAPAPYSSALPTDLSTSLVFVNNSYVSYNSASHGEHIVGVSVKSGFGLVTASVNVNGAPSPSQVVTTPYTGPVVTPPAAVSFRPGGKAVLPGSNLSGVSKVTVDGLDCAVKVNSAGEIEITVPSSLKPGVYDLVIFSDSGTLTVQDGLRVSSSVVLGSNSSVIPSTKLKEDDTVKVYVNDVVGAGKVQIMHNGVEIAWVSASSESDPKLRDGYLVRTIELAPGKNVIEVFVDGKRVDRKAYTKVDDSSRI